MANFDIFKNMAGHYDSPPRMAMAARIAEEMRKHISGDGRRTALDYGRRTALDYGCGTGLVGLALADLFSELLLVDAVPEMVDEVARKIEQLQLTKATVLCRDFCQGSLPTQRFDYILLANVLLHVRDAEGLLARLAQLLCPGGHLLIADFTPTPAVQSELVHPGFDLDLLKQSLLQMGFQKAGGAEFFHGEKLFMGQDATLFLLDAEK